MVIVAISPGLNPAKLNQLPINLIRGLTFAGRPVVDGIIKGCIFTIRICITFPLMLPSFLPLLPYFPLGYNLLPFGLGLLPV